VCRKARMRLEYDGLLASEALTSRNSPFYGDPVGYALERYVYCYCARCHRAYFGGESQCQEALYGAGGEVGGLQKSVGFNPDELVCGQCSAVEVGAGEGKEVGSHQVCGRHGTEFLEYKCRYCCSIAVYFCFGTTHFCASCHADFRRLVSTPRNQLPQCPVGPGCVAMAVGHTSQREGEASSRGGMKCPLRLASHPPTGEEFSLGCGICRNLMTF